MEKSINTYEIPLENFCNLADPKKRKQRFINEIKFLIENRKYTTLLIVICTYIDALTGENPRGENKKEFTKYLKKHFSEYFKGFITADNFYDSFRNGIIHEFRIKPGYCIAESHELKEDLFGKIKIQETNIIYKALNIDKFTKAFIEHIRIAQN